MPVRVAGLHSDLNVETDAVSRHLDADTITISDPYSLLSGEYDSFGNGRHRSEAGRGREPRIRRSSTAVT
jgi:hypothetical protein